MIRSDPDARPRTRPSARLTFVLATILAGLALATLPFLLTLVSWPIAPSLLVLPGVLAGPVSIFVAALVPPLLLWSWAPQLFLGRAEVPARSSIGVAFILVLQGAWFVIFRDRTPFHLALVAVTLLPAAALAALAALANRRGSFALSLAFHSGLVLWLCTVAFPDLGGWP